MFSICKQIANGQPPTIDAFEPLTNGPELEKTKPKLSMSFKHAAGQKRLALMMKVIENGYSHCQNETPKKRRSLYYSLQETPVSPFVKNQNTVDRAIRDAAQFMACDESDLGEYRNFHLR